MTRRTMPILLLLVALGAQGCALLSHQPDDLTPTQVLALTRDTLIGVSHDVEAAHLQALITDAQYAKAKSVTLKAFREYNRVLEQYRLYGTLVQADIDAVGVLLADVRGLLATGAATAAGPKTER